MTRFILSLIAVCFALAVFPASAAERKLSVFGFEAVRISGGVNVDIVTGKSASATASADSQRALDRLSLKKSGNELIITVRAKTNQSDNYGLETPINLRLSTFALKKITHLGSGQVNLDELSGRNSSARVGGFGSLAIADVDSDLLAVSMNGAGELTIAGEARQARVNLMGASVFNGGSLTAEKLKLNQRGPASTHIAVENEVEISNSGTGLIRIDGKPNCLVRSAGSAEIICNPKG